MSDDKAVIRTEKISKIYDSGEVQVEALKGIDLRIEPGELVAIMGASGSGKSAMLNILGCLDYPSGGEYFLDGIHVNGLDRDQLADWHYADSGGRPQRHRGQGVYRRSARLLSAGPAGIVQDHEDALVFRPQPVLVRPVFHRPDAQRSHLGLMPHAGSSSHYSAVAHRRSSLVAHQFPQLRPTHFVIFCGLHPPIKRPCPGPAGLFKVAFTVP